MKVVLYGMKVSENIQKLVIQTILNLQKKGIQVTIDAIFFHNLNLKKNFFAKNLTISSIHSEDFRFVNLLFTFGGDGTILSVLSLIKNYSVPIVGINTGRLGFLTSISEEKFLDCLDDYLNNNFFVSKRNLLQIIGDSSIRIPYALNEIAISRKESSSMIAIKLSINNEYLNTFWGDGLIISTPTGSTGYNLSCGGPILSPENQAIILTPIAGHNLNIRPLVLPNSTRLRFSVTSGCSNEFSLSLDARSYSVSNKIEFEIEIAPFLLKLLFLEGYSYYQTLRNKLCWGTDSRN